MKQSVLHRLLVPLVMSLVGSAFSPMAAGAIQAIIDTDEMRTTPVPHRYLHGVILDDAKFQILLPAAWNGKVAIFTRGFSGTELTTGGFQKAAVAKGYAFASSNEGWSRVTIKDHPEDSYYESRQRLFELTLYTNAMVKNHYGRESTRTLIMGGSNGGHHAKWMLEDFPELYDGGIAGYGFNSQVSQWGGVATVVRNYQKIAARIDDIIAKRMADPGWDPFTTPLSPPLTAAQLYALRQMYDIPAELGTGFRYNAGRWEGSEAEWKARYADLLSYLRDSLPRFDETFNPNGGELTDDELGYWDPNRSPQSVKRELRKLDVSGNLQRPLIIMHGTADPIVSPGESAGYQALVERVLGNERAQDVLAVYYIPGMGHGGAQYDQVIDAQIDALEAWVDYRQSKGRAGAPAPAMIGAYPREPKSGGRHRNRFSDQENNR
jgi:pimeloyl-ACP methyl ester carboxylesterase